MVLKIRRPTMKSKSECEAISKGIQSHHIEPFVEYDVTVERRIVNETARTIEDVYFYLLNTLKVKYPEIYNYCDYVSCNKWDNLTHWSLDYHWVAVYYVTGGSEGYYIHVDQISRTETRIHYFLLKTLYDRKIAEQICNTVANIMEV
jgi:hypothetical protein